MYALLCRLCTAASNSEDVNITPVTNSLNSTKLMSCSQPSDPIFYQMYPFCHPPESNLKRLIIFQKGYLCPKVMKSDKHSRQCGLLFRISYHCQHLHPVLHAILSVSLNYSTEAANPCLGLCPVSPLPTLLPSTNIISHLTSYNLLTELPSQDVATVGNSVISLFNPNSFARGVC